MSDNVVQLYSEPKKSIGSGATEIVSRWITSHNPNIFAFRRWDYEGTAGDDATNTTIVIAGQDVTTQFPNGTSVIFWNSASDIITTTVLSSSFSTDTTIILAATELGLSGTAYIVNTDTDLSGGAFLEIDWQVSGESIDENPLRYEFRNGLIAEANTELLNANLIYDETNPLTETTFLDPNRWFGFTFQYRVSTVSTTGSYTAGDDWYMLCAAKQLGSADGGNLIDYLAKFPTVEAVAKGGRFLTETSQPIAWAGYPYYLGFITGNWDSFQDPFFVGRHVEELDVNHEPISGTAETITVNYAKNGLTRVRVPQTKSDPTTRFVRVTMVEAAAGPDTNLLADLTGLFEESGMVVVISPSGNKLITTLEGLSIIFLKKVGFGNSFLINDDNPQGTVHIWGDDNTAPRLIVQESETQTSNFLEFRDFAGTVRAYLSQSLDFFGNGVAKLSRWVLGDSSNIANEAEIGYNSTDSRAEIVSGGQKRQLLQDNDTKFAEPSDLDGWPTDAAGVLTNNGSGGLAFESIASRTTQTTLTAAQVKALDTTPVQIAPAPGVNKRLVPVKYVWVLNYGTEEFDFPAGAFVVFSLPFNISIGDVDAVFAIPAQDLNDDFTKQVSDTPNTADLTSPSDISFYSNKPLEVSLSGTTATQGDSTLTILVEYLVIDV